MNGVRLQTQNFASGSAIRRSAASCGSLGRSTAAARRIASAVAASDSTARSAITFCINGLSAKSPPNAERWATCHEASARDRKSDGEGKRVSVRVDLGGRRINKKKKTYTTKLRNSALQNKQNSIS